MGMLGGRKGNVGERVDTLFFFARFRDRQTLKSGIAKRKTVESCMSLDWISILEEISIPQLG